MVCLKFPLRKLQSLAGLAVIPQLIPLHFGLLPPKLPCHFILRFWLILSFLATALLLCVTASAPPTRRRKTGCVFIFFSLSVCQSVIFSPTTCAAFAFIRFLWLSAFSLSINIQMQKKKKKRSCNSLCQFRSRVRDVFIETGLFTQSPPTHFVFHHEQLAAQR